MSQGLGCWRWVAGLLVATHVLTAIAREVPNIDAGVLVLDDRPRTLQLIASKAYQPARRSDAEARFEQVLRFAVPAELAVVGGDAGNHLAYLAFAFAQRYELCVYRGTGQQSRPPGRGDAGRGTKYLLNTCSHGLHAGDQVTADFLRLSILGGDPRAGSTTVQLVLLDLSPPAPPSASALARSGLDKARTGQHTAALGGLGHARYRDGDRHGALAEYGLALAADPGLIEAHLARAVVRTALGDLDGANADRQEARIKAPSDQVSH